MALVICIVEEIDDILLRISFKFAILFICHCAMNAKSGEFGFLLEQE
jgi:hypothetical protein